MTILWGIIAIVLLWMSGFMIGHWKGCACGCRSGWKRLYETVVNDEEVNQALMEHRARIADGHQSWP